MKPRIPIALLLLPALLWLASCTSTRWVNTGGYWLESVNTPDHIANPFLTEKGVYVDDSITVKLEMWDDGFDLNIKNLGKESLRIRWDQCSYTDEKGTTHKVMHMKNRNLLTGAIVKGGATCNDFIAPADQPEHSEYEGELLPLWRINSYKSKAEAEAARPDSSSVSITLALQKGDRIDDYIFTFAGDDYQTEKVNVPNVKNMFLAWDATLLSMTILYCLTFAFLQ